jgi:hypothetical protein
VAGKPTFEIGLTMAGAVSAGAYTAGVIDFLFEALDAIEDVRAGRSTAYLNAGLSKQNLVFDPPHDVKIRAMSGTSAGSMVTAIVATILGTRAPPVTPMRAAADETPTTNPLYDAWVAEIHYDKLLSTGDIAKQEPVHSLLNSAPLNGIVDNTLRYVEHENFHRPYVSDPIPIYFCVSNLRGVRYSLQLNVDRGVPTEYQMSMHADWLRFEWSRTPSPSSLSPGALTDAWKRLGKAALASGAFPVGLSAQSLSRDFEDYIRRKWFDAASNTEREFPPLDKPSDFPPEGKYAFVNADGGIFNNEPLELCRLALAGTDGRNPRDPKDAHRAVILIDPFPNLFDLEVPYDLVKHRELLDVIKNVFSAMISQARFKVDELALAHDPEVASRFAIMPVRYDQNDKQAKYAIACGSLGGFGGFLSKTFRHHDFMLGRRNCQKFLASHFALPCDRAKGVENPLFAQWPDNLRAAFRIPPSKDDPPSEPDYLPIVPLLGKLASPAYTEMPAWPSKPSDVKQKELKSAIIARADKVKDSLVAQYQPKWYLQAGIESYWWLKKGDWIDRFAMQPMIKSLSERGITIS